jgi:hypothetical protein
MKPPHYIMLRSAREEFVHANRGNGRKTFSVRIAIFFFLLGLTCLYAAPPEKPCYPMIRLVGSRSAANHERIYSFSFKSDFSHPVYYLAYTKAVHPGAGMPYHYEAVCRFGRWSSPQLALLHVSMEFRRLRPGDTLEFSVTRRRPFWPWRVSVLFYAFPDYAALTGDVGSETITE